jgi:hypothetical protein
VTVLFFRIEFHGPFHVARGTAEAGIDQTVDVATPLPASSLKGLMRAEARALITEGRLLSDVFGGDGKPSAWAWSDARFEDGPTFRRLARLKLAGSDSTVAPGHADGSAEVGLLRLGHHVWATRAYFTVTNRIRMDEPNERTHRLVLRAAARSVSGLGGGRRRGEGWVTVTDLNPEGDPTAWTEADSRELLSLQKQTIS